MTAASKCSAGVMSRYASAKTSPIGRCAGAGWRGRLLVATLPGVESLLIGSLRVPRAFPAQHDALGVAQRHLTLLFSLLPCVGLSIALGESHHTTRPNIELPPCREGLIAPPSPFVPGAVGRRAAGGLIEAETGQTVVFEFQDAREPLHILWGV